MAHIGGGLCPAVDFNRLLLLLLMLMMTSMVGYDVLNWKSVLETILSDPFVTTQSTLIFSVYIFMNVNTWWFCFYLFYCYFVSYILLFCFIFICIPILSCFYIFYFVSIILCLFVFCFFFRSVISSRQIMSFLSLKTYFNTNIL